MSHKLRIDELKDCFKEKPFTNEQLYSFYSEKESNLNDSAFRWRIHALKESSVIYGIKRGIYVVGKKEQFLPPLSQEIHALYGKLFKRFSYARILIWETRWLHRYMIHQPMFNNIIVEIDKEATFSAFSFLQESMVNVFLTPSKGEIKKYIQPLQNNVIVKNYLVENPINKKLEIPVPRIEKIMVDLLVEKDLYSAYQGKELTTIYTSILARYVVNQSTLNRYATKRNAKSVLQSFLLNNDKNEQNLAYPESTN